MKPDKKQIDRGREGLFLRAFGKRNIGRGYAEDCGCKREIN